MERKVNYKDFLKIYFRSFLYQNLLNTQNFQNFGFMYVLYPIIKKFKIQKESIIQSLLRNFEYFNTNPYFVSFVFGVALRLIERKEEEKLNRFKFDIMSPLAGLGDAFAWGIVKPFFVLISAGLILLNQWWGWLIFVVGYNLILNGFFRYYGIVIGYKYGINFIFKLAKFNLQNIIYHLKQISLIIWGSLFYLLLVSRYKIFHSITTLMYTEIKSFYMISIIILFVFIYNYINKKFIPVVTYLIYMMFMILLYIIYK